MPSFSRGLEKALHQAMNLARERAHAAQCPAPDLVGAGVGGDQGSGHRTILADGGVSGRPGTGRRMAPARGAEAIRAPRDPPATATRPGAAVPHDAGREPFDVPTT